MNDIKTSWSALGAKQRRIIRLTAGLLLGSLAGYAYYAVVGCGTGGCLITSSPWISTLWGAVIGGTASA